MIKLLGSGSYKLVETVRHHKVLYIDSQSYVWIEAKNIGEILIASYSPHKTDCLLSTGRYRIYEVEDEPDLQDQVHLELDVGAGLWQGYLLLSGLPNSDHKRGRIIPTHEVITANPAFLARRSLAINH